MGSSQLLSPLAKGRLTKGAPINGLLIVRHAIDQSKLSRDLVPGIAEQRKAQLVLVRHEE